VLDREAIVTEDFCFPHFFPCSRISPKGLFVDFFLFSIVKNTWKGKRLDDVEITEHSEMEQLLPIPETDFREIFPVSSGTVEQGCTC
jgi:hypothetical protein